MLTSRKGFIFNIDNPFPCGEAEPAELGSEGKEPLLLELEVAALESTGILLKAAQVGSVEYDTCWMLEGVELNKGEVDAVKFEETGTGGVELDAAEESAVVELETGMLIVVLHAVVVGPSFDVKGYVFHKPRQHDNK